MFQNAPSLADRTTGGQETDIVIGESHLGSIAAATSVFAPTFATSSIRRLQPPATSPRVQPAPALTNPALPAAARLLPTANTAVAPCTSQSALTPTPARARGLLLLLRQRCPAGPQRLCGAAHLRRLCQPSEGGGGGACTHARTHHARTHVSITHPCHGPHTWPVRTVSTLRGHAHEHTDLPSPQPAALPHLI